MSSSLEQQLLSVLVRLIIVEYIRKSAEPVLSLVSRYKGSRIARQVETRTPKAPRQCKYIDALSTTSDKNRPKLMRVVYNTPHEAFFVALFLTCR